MPPASGRHFLQIPGPTNVPDRILRAMDRPTIDHRGPEFAALGHRVIDGMKRLIGAQSGVYVFPASGTGAWEAALVNTLSPDDHILMAETGHFASQWATLAERCQFKPQLVPSDWRSGANPVEIATILEADAAHRIKAVCVVHNETSTGAVSPIADVRAAMDGLNHPALLMVDTISSLACMAYQQDNWGVDVTVAGSQKGLMLPPGLSFNGVSERALEASRTSRSAKSYWSWEAMDEPNRSGFFPYTPATNLLFGLAEAIDALEEEGLANVFARHERLASAARSAVTAWGLELLCRTPAHHSSSLTAVLMPDGHDADRFRRVTLERFNLSLGNGLSRLAGKVFRIGHLGDMNELMLLGALAGIEMGLTVAGVPHDSGGVQAAMRELRD